MKKVLLFSTVFLVFGILGYFTFLYALPYLIIRGLQSNRALVFHEFIHTELPNEKSRQVVAPNPDFLYSLAPYNLSNGVMVLEGELPDSGYASVSLFDQSSSCFYVKNDLQYKDKKVRICIAQADQEINKSEMDAEVVRAPSKYGIVLLRFLAVKPSQVQKLKQYQQSWIFR